MANIQVTFDSNPQNARSESNLAINPNNPLQVVSASKKFANIETYNFTLATEYSTDGGKSWHDSAPLTLPAGQTVMTDPTLAWDDSGNVFLVGLVGTLGTTPPVWQDTGGIVMYKSTDGGQTWSLPYPIAGTTDADKQWAAGDTNPASPFHGNVYAVWDATSRNGMAFAMSTDHGVTWVGAGGVPAGSLIFTGTAYPEIHVSADGFIYIVAMAGNEVQMLISTDGGDTFNPCATPPATGVTTLSDALPISDSGFPTFTPNGNFRVLTDPTICSQGPEVYVAWADYREGASRIYLAHSIDAGTTWTTGASGQPLLTQSIPSNFQHFHPQLVIPERRRRMQLLRIRAQALEVLDRRDPLAIVRSRRLI